MGKSGILFVRKIGYNESLNIHRGFLTLMMICSFVVQIDVKETQGLIVVRLYPCTYTVSMVFRVEK